METNFGVQTLHCKYYLRIKPRNFWSSKTNETALVKFIAFSVTSQSHCAQAIATVLSQDQVNLSLEGLRRVFLSTIRNLAHTVIRVLSRGQNYRFCTVVTDEPRWNGSSDITRRRSPLE